MASRLVRCSAGVGDCTYGGDGVAVVLEMVKSLLYNGVSKV